MLQNADVDPTLRPTELTIPQFRALADAYAHLCMHEPSLLHYEFREELRLAKQGNKPEDTFIMDEKLNTNKNGKQEKPTNSLF